MPLPGNPSGAGNALVLQRGAGTSASAGPSAGTSAAVNFPRTSMHGAFDKEIVLAESSHASQLAEGVAQPVPNRTPAVTPQTIVSVLQIIGAFGFQFCNGLKSRSGGYGFS